MPTETSISLRVRYRECDPMSMAHHSVYPVWLEMARTELLREQGVAYADLEKESVFFVVARLNLRYRRPAFYDDELNVRVWTPKTAGVKIEHQYRVFRSEQLLAEAESVLACVDREGRLRSMPGKLIAAAKG